MKKYKNIIFDMDGTLIDSRQGIYEGIDYSMEKLGLAPLPEEVKRKFIGPTLYESYMEHCLFDKDTALEAIKYYREIYSAGSCLHFTPYDGVISLVKRLHSANYLLSVASAKPHIYVDKVVEKMGLTGYFDKVVGADVSIRSSDKKGLVKASILDNNALMVGDTIFDIAGAKDNSIDCVAVSYGFASRQELALASPTMLVDSVAELTRLFFDDVIVG